MTSRLPSRLLLGLLVTLPAWPAWGDTGRELSVGVLSVSHMSFFRNGPSRLGLGVAYRHPLGPGGGLAPWSIQVGGRAALPDAWTPLPLELFVRPQLRAALGCWEPAVGLEAGVSGLTDLGRRYGTLPLDFYELEQRRVSPFYFAFVVAPLRLRLGAFRVSALELLLGTTLSPPGAVGRFQLEFLNVGVSL